MQALHNLLSKMQDTIARTGDCDPNDLAEANRLLSADGVNLEFKNENGVSIKQIILGRNRFNNDKFKRLYMPPIESLLQHERVVKCTSVVNRAVRRMSMLKDMSANVALAVVGGITLIGIIIPPLGLAGALVGGLAEGLLILGVPLGLVEAEESRKALAAGYHYLSTYHNPFVFTNKNWLRIKEAIKSLLGLKEKSAQKILSLDELVKQAQPTKEQKLAALNEIKNIPDLIERKKALENTVGLGEQGKDHPYYRFLSYQRLWTTANAERGTLKLAHDALAETNKQIDADIQAQVKDVFDSSSTKKIADKIGFDLNKYLEKMSLLENAPSAPSEAPTNFPLAPRHAPAANSANDEVRTALRQ